MSGRPGPATFGTVGSFRPAGIHVLLSGFKEWCAYGFFQAPCRQESCQYCCCNNAVSRCGLGS
eukprot:6105341-Alexandrium_andersonii.AAC.1